MERRHAAWRPESSAEARQGTHLAGLEVVERFLHHRGHCGRKAGRREGGTRCRVRQLDRPGVLHRAADTGPWPKSLRAAPPIPHVQPLTALRFFVCGDNQGEVECSGGDGPAVVRVAEAIRYPQDVASGQEEVFFAFQPLEVAWCGRTPQNGKSLRQHARADSA